MFHKILLTYNTVKYLKPIQVLYQLRLKVLKSQNSLKEYKKPDKINNLKIMIEELDLDQKYLNRFDVNKLLKNEVLLLNELHKLNYETWNVKEASHLWNFNLHYLEYTIPLAAEYYNTKDEMYYYKFKEIVENWIEFSLTKSGDAWHPYTISIRLPNLLICLDLFEDIIKDDEDFKNMIYGSIYNQYQFLLRNKEKHLLGNHYFENLKTIIICAILFDDKERFYWHVSELKKQIDEQILDDGVHFELSVMYHKIILEDIIRVTYYMSQYEEKEYKLLIPTIEKMISALVSLEQGLGKVPHFNDSAKNISKDTIQLVATANILFNVKHSYHNTFPDAGYLKYCDEGIALLFDVGAIGPSYMAGHGHCDALSFELSLDNIPVFVNSGTYNYQSNLRNYFRSTEAHNTFMIENQQQSELWGEHRVARRITNVMYSTQNNKLTGLIKNYHGSLQKREISVFTRNQILIKDTVIVKTPSLIYTYFHLAPGHQITFAGEKYQVVNKDGTLICKLSFKNAVEVCTHTEGVLSNYSSEFGKLEKKHVFEVCWHSTKSYLQTEIEFL